MKRNKSGISLIVLVITIIVMIILAAAVVIALDNSGIINKANEAVDSSNLKQVQHLASLIWAEGYLDKMNMDAAYIKEKLADQGINTDKYDITVEENGVVVTEKKQGGNADGEFINEYTEENIPIPVGFVKSPYEGEGTKNEGLVIYALTEEEIAAGVTDITTIDANHQVSLTTRNQFVWVPVNYFEEEFVRTAFDGRTISQTLGRDHWELALDENNMPSSTLNTGKYVSEATLTEATAMYSSVKKYGGFYIGRYEVGNSTYDVNNEYEATRVSISQGTNKNLSVKMGNFPYSNLRWGETMYNEVTDDGAVSLAREFYPADENVYGVVSTLIYGVQWDRTLNWWKELNPQMDVLDQGLGLYWDTILTKEELNSGAMYSEIVDKRKCTDNYDECYNEIDTICDENGENCTDKCCDYVSEREEWKLFESNQEAIENSMFTTGAYKKANVYNIYDMAGNLSEITMEGTNNGPGRVFRGAINAGSRCGDGCGNSAAAFRIALYVK